MATSPEGYYTTDEFWYADNGNAVLKRTWIDPSTGQTWDTFDTRPGSYDLPNGTVFNPDTYQAPASNEGASASVTPHYETSGVSNTVAIPRSSGSNPPQRDDYASNPSAQGGNPGGNPKPTGNPIQAAQGGVSGASGVPNYGSGGQGNSDFLRNRAMFDYGTNPEFAFSNVLSSMGMNPLMPTPWMNLIRQQAMPLQAAYMMQAANGYNPGMDPYGGYQSFVQNALQNGSLQGIYSGLASNMGSIANQSRDFFNQLQANPNLSNVNPLMADLAYAMMGQNGIGGLGLISNLVGQGLLGGRVGQAYGQAVKGAGQSAMRNVYINGGVENPNGSIFDYLFQ